MEVQSGSIDLAEYYHLVQTIKTLEHKLTSRERWLSEASDMIIAMEDKYLADYKQIYQDLKDKQNLINVLSAENGKLKKKMKRNANG